jgi:dethiobiotin synthetase
LVLAAVARHLRQQGCAIRVSKPVATGAEWDGRRWLSPDTRLLAEAAGRHEGYEGITPFTFAEPVAPPVAARRHGVELTLDALEQAVWGQAEGQALLLVEGVGGLLCPLTERETVADLAERLGLPLVVVVRRSLGTLNHTLLTLEAARRRGLAVAGMVVNETEPPRSLAEETNVDELRRRTDVPLLTVVPHQSQPGPGVPPAVASVAWRELCSHSAGAAGRA